MIFALFGGAVGCFAFIVVAIAMVGLFVKKSQTDSTAADIAGGSTSGLDSWTPSSLAELSRNVTGDWYYQRPLGGRRVSRLTASVWSCHTRRELLRMSGEKGTEGSGQLTLLASWTRLDITFTPSSCQIWANRVELGTLGFSSGRISDPRGAELGAYQRGPHGGRLFLRGRDVAQVRASSELTSELTPAPEPFCASLAPSVDEEASLFLLAIIALEVGNFAMPRGGMVL